MFSDWLKKEIPQNLLLRKPWLAFMVISVFGFLFMVIYTPFDSGQKIERVEEYLIKKIKKIKLDPHPIDKVASY